jgi:hypothetical protein
MGADHGGDLLHGLDLRAHDVGAPLSQHGGNDVELPAIEDIAQLFAIESGAGGAFGGELDEEAIEFAGLVGGEFAFILEQGPAQTFERRIGSLLGAPHLVYGLARMSDHMELIEGNLGLWWAPVSNRAMSPPLVALRPISVSMSRSASQVMPSFPSQVSSTIAVWKTHGRICLENDALLRAGLPRPVPRITTQAWI